MNSDFKELLQTFNEESVRYLVVGGYAVIHHSQPRYTKDLDLWVEPTAENARRVAKSFLKFGLPLDEVTQEDFATEGTQFFIGIPPCAFDFLTTISGLVFSHAWENKVLSDEDGVAVPYLGKADLITAKKAAGRLQDLADLEEIERFES
jgi:hypothetical protein